MRTIEETRIKKAHITLMQHGNTALYSGVIASGKNEFTQLADGYCFY